jgi:hypothetical protein
MDAKTRKVSRGLLVTILFTPKRENAISVTDHNVTIEA